MLIVIPRYLERLDPAEDRTRRMFTSMGVSADTLESTAGQSVVLRLRRGAGTARALLAGQLLDLLVRLQPLVARVYLDCPDEREVVGDLPDRFPLELDDPGGLDGDGEALVVDVGEPQGTHDLLVDGAGWCLSADEGCEVADDGNPIGPLAAAGVGAGEVFKLLFRQAHPPEPLSSRFVPQHGCFSLFDYSASQLSPPLDDVLSLDAVIVGVGGVGAGVLSVFAALGKRLVGRLVLIDDDTLDMYNLNRVTYARTADAEAERLKVDAAAEFMRARAPNITTAEEPVAYKAYARQWNRRADRKFALVLTGVDIDEIRWEVQRDLPRVLIDGATGTQANCRVDRIGFGLAGCIGCARPPQPARGDPDPAECDTPPARFAPSISFNSAFAGVLVGAEALKVMGGSAGSSVLRSCLHLSAKSGPRWHPWVRPTVPCRVPGSLRTRGVSSEMGEIARRQGTSGSL